MMNHQLPRRAVLARFVFMNIAFSVVAGAVPHAYAQAIPDSIPGPADANRIPPQPQNTLPPEEKRITVKEETLPSTQIPEGADQIHLTLKGVAFEGVTAFTAQELTPLYAKYLGKDVTLDTVYKIADNLTKMYRDRGYFLSMAYVPDQKIGNGAVKIAAIEGHISDIEMQGDTSQGRVLTQYMSRIKANKPVKSDQLESFLLRINDLPGVDYRAVLAQMPKGAPGSVKLVLVPQAEKGRGQVSIDNYGSRYLGPHEASVFYTKSLVPMTQTSVSALVSVPTKELKYFTAEQSFTVAPDIRVKLAGNVTKSDSGYTLNSLDVLGNSTDVSGAVEWQPIRQREKNVVVAFKLERRNTKTDILDTPFSKDRVRAARASVHYDGRNYISGYDFADVTWSRGLTAWGASQKGDPDTSRPEANPGFSKLEAKLTHLQSLGHDVVMSASAAGQWASGPMYASEEFGYGGQSFGRAYDSSEITGDHGIAGSMEFQYNGVNTGEFISLSPYVFYDIGQVWNEDAGQPEKASGASAGLGVRGAAMTETNYNFGLAFPLTRSVMAPAYGKSTDAPRFFAQVNQNF